MKRDWVSVDASQSLFILSVADLSDIHFKSNFSMRIIFAGWNKEILFISLDFNASPF